MESYRSTPLEEAANKMSGDELPLEVVNSREPIVVAQTQSETETEIVIGALADAGVQGIMRQLAAPSLGGFLGIGSTRWADILVPADQAERALETLKYFRQGTGNT